MNNFEEFREFPGVWSRSVTMHEDSRGYFYEELRRDVLPESVPEFVQDSMSFSRRKVLRGMHLQLKQSLVTISSPDDEEMRSTKTCRCDQSLAGLKTQ